MMKKLITITLLLITTTLYSQTIEVEVDNAYINIGEWTTFTVTATGDFKNIKYSEPDGLTMKQIGKSTSYSFVNGKKSNSYILKYRVKSDTAGKIELPYFFTEDKDGNEIRSEVKTIYVTALEDSKITDHNIESTFETPYVKLFLELPDRNLYVGEAIDAKVTAYFSKQYQPGIQRTPYVKTGSFLIDSSEKYRNMPDVVINGESWIQVQWDTFLTPLKAGTTDIEVKMDSYIEKPVPGGGFFSSSEREDIKTSTEITTINILPIPMENRPESFTGAIGEFQIEGKIDQSDIKVGEPVTITIDIFGSGNFQRIMMPNIKDNEWKTYPESSTFNGSNGSNYKGVKTFQQIISPENEDLISTPEFKFSYFDPVKEEFQELTTGRFQVSVSPGEFINKVEDEKMDLLFNEQKERMRHVKKGNSQNYTDITAIPFFYIAIVISILLILTSITLIVLKKHKNRAINENKLYKEFETKIKNYEKSGDYCAALRIYKDLICKHYSIKNKINADSVTSLDVEKALEKGIIDKIDEINYTSSNLNEKQYRELTNRVLEGIRC